MARVCSCRKHCSRRSPPPPPPILWVCWVLGALILLVNDQPPYFRQVKGIPHLRQSEKPNLSGKFVERVFILEKAIQGLEKCHGWAKRRCCIEGRHALKPSLPDLVGRKSLRAKRDGFGNWNDEDLAPNKKQQWRTDVIGASRRPKKKDLERRRRRRKGFRFPGACFIPHRSSRRSHSSSTAHHGDVKGELLLSPSDKFFPYSVLVQLCYIRLYLLDFIAHVCSSNSNPKQIFWCRTMNEEKNKDRSKGKQQKLMVDGFKTFIKVLCSDSSFIDKFDGSAEKQERNNKGKQPTHVGKHDEAAVDRLRSHLNLSEKSSCYSLKKDSTKKPVKANIDKVEFVQF